MTDARPSRSAVRLPRTLSATLAAATLLGTLTGTIGVAATAAHATGGLTLTPTTTERITPGTTAAVQGMSISGDATDTLQATVATDSGTLAITMSGTDTLAYNNAASGTASVTFTGTQADINTALGTTTLTAPASNGTAHISLTAMVAQSGINYLSSNQHLYQFISGNVTWQQADAGAKTHSFNGQPGYLATVPNATANAFIASKIQGAQNVWLGARAYEKNATDGTAQYATAGGVQYPRVWRWTVGADESPIAGTVVSECTNVNPVCTFVSRSSFYDSWASGEPNNSGTTGTAYSGEWAPVDNWQGSSGLWNDLPPTAGGYTIGGYVVEYGGKTNTDPTLGTGFAGVVTTTGDIVINAAASAPSAPVISGVAGNGKAILSWSPPTDGGSPITGYEYSTDGTSWTALPTPTATDTVVNGNVVTTDSVTVTGLTNGQPSNLRVRADNAAVPGLGAASNVVSVTPYTVPDAPVVSFPGSTNFTVSLTWSQPANNGRAITGYTVTASPGGRSCTTVGAASTSCTITRLQPGTSFGFSVVATNAAGDSAAGTTGTMTASVAYLASQQPVNANDPQHTTVSVPSGGSVSLRDGQGNSLTHLTVTGQGAYSLDTATGVITFTPVLGYTGTPDPVTYRLSDGQGEYGDGTYAPSLVTAPAAPVAADLTPSSPPVSNQPQSATPTVPNGGSVTLLDARGDAVTTVVIDGEGTYTLSGGVITFTPLLGFTGTPTPVDYRITDAYEQTSDATFAPGAVTAPAAPSAPSITPNGPVDSNQPQHATVTVPTGGSATLLDAHGNPVTSVTIDGEGTYTISGGTITFTPVIGYVGTPTPVYYQITDAYGQTSDGTFAPDAVTAPAAPTAPTLTPSSATVDNQPQHATITIPDHGSVTLLDANGDPATTVVVDGEGTYVLDPATGVVTFTPALGWTGTPTPVGYRVTDAYGQSTDSEFDPNTVTAPPLPTPPMLTSPAGSDRTGPQHATATIPTNGSITLLDANGNAATTVTFAGEGTYVLDPATGELTFTPQLGFLGVPDPVMYEITDAYGQLAASTFMPAGVLAPAGPTAPPAPVTRTGAGVGGQPQQVTVTIPAGGSVTLVDANGDPATTITVDGEGSYTVDPATGVVTFTPDPGFHGTPTPAPYRVTDAYGQTATGSVAPATVTIAPTAPKVTQVVVGDGKVTLTIAAPVSDGGQPVTGYTVVVGPTGQRVPVTDAGTLTIDGLTNGSDYTFTVVATNVVGTSPASAPAAATPVASGAPGLKNLVVGNHKASVTVVPPASTGTPIAGYVVTLQPGGATQRLTGAAGGPVSFTGLTNGVHYTATVQTQYASTAGPTGPSLVLTPMTVASAPKVHAKPALTKIAVKLTAPKSNGGSPVKSYRVVVTGPGLTKAWTVTLPAKKKSVTVYGLRPGTKYHVSVTALNAAGRSKARKVVARTAKSPIAGLSITDVAGHPIASGTTVNIGADAAFAFNSAEMTPTMVRSLTVLARAGKGHKAITCSGYSDFGGDSTQHEYDLALQRAQAVCAFLKAHGVSVHATVVSYGPSRPLVTTGDRDARAANRRVTITFG